MPGLTNDQLADRQHYLGGTDMAALAGVSPWASPLDVFHDKRPDLAPAGWGRPASEVMSLGHYLEPVICQLFSDRTGIKLRRIAQAVRCPDHPWEGGLVDRIGLRTDSDATNCGGVVEAKFSSTSHGWDVDAATPDDQPHAVLVRESGARPVVSRPYYVQVQWYLHVAGRHHAHVAALLGYGRFVHFALGRDVELIDHLVELARLAWHDNILPGVPPPPDGSDAAGRALRARFPETDEGELVATPEDAALVDELLSARAGLDVAERSYERARQLVQARMGSAAVLLSPGARITWRQNRPSDVTDWASAWAEAATRLPDALDILTRHTRTVPGPRVFRIHTDREA